jgi:putative redox protein
METTVRFLSGVQFEAETRGLKILCDQPVENGGENAGMTPPEFLLASLGTCAGYYALQYLIARKLATEGLSVQVSAGKASQPARMDDFKITIDVPGLDDPRHREGVVRAAKNCLIHNTLSHHPLIELTLANADVARS